MQKDLDNTTEKQTTKEFLSFKSINDLNEIRNKVSKMSIEELSRWQKTQKMSSIGVHSDFLINKMINTEFKSQEEIISHINLHQDYLQLVKDKQDGSLTLEPILYNCPFRYFISHNRLLTIGETAYKCFEEGFITTSLPNISKLKNIHSLESFTNKKNFDTTFDVQYYSNLNDNNKKSNGLGWTQIERDSPIMDGNKTKVVLTSEYYRDSYGQQDLTQIRLLVRPYKRTMGIWFWCNRTIAANVEIIEYLIGYRNQYNQYTETYKYRIYGTLPVDGIPYKSSQPEGKYETLLLPLFSDYVVTGCLISRVKLHASTPSALGVDINERSPTSQAPF